MNTRLTIIERATELAATGHYLKVSEIKDKLRREGFERVDGHFSGAAIYKQLRTIIAAVKSARQPIAEPCERQASYV